MAAMAALMPALTALVRCELDGLPIEEAGRAPYRSQVPGKGHLCGHDGHMSILVGLARLLSRRRPATGRAVLLFQPAEEDGQGAARVIDDPAYADIRPDYAFALHNFPGLPQGRAILGAGPVNCASRGLRITLGGRTAHASQPETGRSPMAAMAALMPALTALGRDAPFRLVTVTHCTMGAPSFGVAPGAGEIWATLRTARDAEMDALLAEAEALVRAHAGGLEVGFGHHDVFLHCENDAEAVRVLAAACARTGIAQDAGTLPLRFSEDFGRFGHHARAAMLFLGAGTDCAALHDPDYDFPDDLIAQGVHLFAAALEELGLIAP
jgi:amidohydrolase